MRAFALAALSFLVSCQPQKKESGAVKKLVENISVLDVQLVKIESPTESLTLEKKSDQWFATTDGLALKALGSQINTLLLLVSNQPRGLVMDYTAESLKKLDLEWPTKKIDSNFVRLKIVESGKTHTLRLGQFDVPPEAMQDATILGMEAVARRFVFHEEERRLSLVDQTLSFINPNLKYWVITKFHPVNRIKKITVSKRLENHWTASRKSPFHGFELSSGEPVEESINLCLSMLFETGAFVLPVTQQDQQLLSEASQHSDLKFENFDGYTYHMIVGGKKVVELGDAAAQESGMVVSDVESSVECYAVTLTVKKPDGALLDEYKVFIPCKDIDPIL